MRLTTAAPLIITVGSMSGHSGVVTVNLRQITRLSGGIVIETDTEEVSLILASRPALFHAQTRQSSRIVA